VIHAAKRSWNGISERANAFSPEFDVAYGVETTSVVDLAELNINSPNWIYGTLYEPVREPQQLERVLRALPIAHEDFSFIDFGSGKGRALLVACRFPFRAVIGVEFCQNLHDVAQRNLQSLVLKTKQCRDLRSVCMDAADFIIPEEPIVVFLNNPFVGPVLDRMVANLRRSLEQVPRSCFVLYFHPFHINVFEAAGFRRISQDGNVYAVLDWPLGTARSAA
jgi:hypothetical protein